MARAIRWPCDEAVIRSKQVESACAPNFALWVLVATILGSSMAFIDETALPVVRAKKPESRAGQREGDVEPNALEP